MPLATFFRRKNRSTVRALYGAIVAAARMPVFYERWGVPDTLDGRFELIVLHAFLVLRRLKQANDCTEFAQALFDTMFADLDRSLREMGASDLGVGRQVKGMARAFYGRILAYERGLANATSLEDAVRRNLYGTTVPETDQVSAAVAYLRHQAQVLDKVPLVVLLSGKLPLAREV